MDFLLNDEQRQIVAMVRELAKTKIAPNAARWDVEEKFPEELVEIFAEAGLFGLPVPEEYGGLGADALTRVLVVEELSKVDASAALLLAVHDLGLTPIVVGASEEQKQRWLPNFATGKWLAAFALTEPGAGSDPGGMVMRARREGDEYVLNGSKIFISNGSIAHGVTVFARTDPNSKGPRGISAFLVEKGTPGFTAVPMKGKLGLHASDTAQLFFEECRVPVSNRLGEEGEGFQIAMKTLDRSRANIAAQALGVAEGAFEYALNYVQERQQFGQQVASFQGVQFMLADMATAIEAARGLTYQAAIRIEREGKGGARLVTANRYSAMAKMFATDVAMRVTTDAVQLLGGYGVIRDYPVERMMRDAKIFQIYEGTNQIQRIVIARSYLGGTRG
ncbi:MAG: acyl-CoA dehydrogenase [Firmicutes bacterium ZCTH02-B6]|nr:MAG: acyl-CoA dehydrogenase [Firmicutes bacterium ZCTH02-B6]